MDHEQRINMEFCLKLQNKSAKETHEMLKLVYGDAAVTMKTVNRRFGRFGNGCESVGDEGRSGRPSASNPQDNVERVSEMIRSNRRLTIRRISEDLNISCGSVEDILENRFEYEASECEICSKCFGGRTKSTAFVNSIGVARSCRFRFQLFRKCHHGR